MAVPMKEELRFAYLNADLFCIEFAVLIQLGMVDVVVIIENCIMLNTTPGVQSVVRDTLGIAVMPKWCAGSVDYLQTVSSNIL